MADCYTILARAVSRLATNNAQARQKLYEHARKILIVQLRRQHPQISALETIREQIAFETAILRLEAKARSIPERGSENFATDYAPLTDTNETLDFASLLREPVEVLHEAAEVWPHVLEEVSPAPDILLSPFSHGTRCT